MVVGGARRRGRELSVKGNGRWKRGNTGEYSVETDNRGRCLTITLHTCTITLTTTCNYITGVPSPSSRPLHP